MDHFHAALCLKGNVIYLSISVFHYHFGMTSLIARERKCPPTNFEEDAKEYYAQL